MVHFLFWQDLLHVATATADFFLIILNAQVTLGRILHRGKCGYLLRPKRFNERTLILIRTYFNTYLFKR